ncbi:pilus assembly protein TadG-related protein [Agromyces sp. CCNWLW203]|uniref:pilus assembly protein TadG-related protein n=1 Tax=Agromyces sp. CCNWLW203 TaxID=3112842 RepID=UPI002F962307
MAVVIAVLAVPLLVCLAFVVDSGLLYWEKTQLQNGADAAALAVADECISTSGGCVGNAGAVATGIAGKNANDTKSDGVIRTITANTRSGNVTVDAVSPAGNGVPHPFASLLDPQADSRLTADATVKWGVPESGTTIPLAVAQCELTRHFNPGTEEQGEPFILLLIGPGNGDKKPDECAPGYPGGFGWLAGDDVDNDGDADCQVLVEVGVPEDGVPGKSDTKAGGCPDDYITKLIGTTVLIPIYDSYTPDSTGNQGSYNISRFAAFFVTGYHVASAKCDPPGAKSGSDCYLSGASKSPGFKGGEFGLQGYFERYVAIGDDFELGEGGPDGGLVAVRVID